VPIPIGITYTNPVEAKNVDQISITFNWTGTLTGGVVYQASNRPGPDTATDEYPIADTVKGWSPTSDTGWVDITSVSGTLSGANGTFAQTYDGHGFLWQRFKIYTSVSGTIAKCAYIAGKGGI